MVGAGRELLNVLVQVLERDCCRSPLSVLLVRAVEEDQVWVHCLAEEFVVVELTVGLASANLLVLLLYLQFLFCELLTNENHRNVQLFRLPFEQSTDIAFNDAFTVYMLIKFGRRDFLKVLDVMLSRILIDEGRLELVSKGKIPNGSRIGLVDIRLLHFLIDDLYSK